jgi:predicted transcriptional regulator
MKKHVALTELELKIITILWDLGGGTVRDIVDAQSAEPPLAYTTVATVLKILEDKGFIRSSKSGRVLVYSARLTREAYQARTLGDLVERVFAGDPMSLVTRLLDTKHMTKDDLERLRALVDREGVAND